MSGYIRSSISSANLRRTRWRSTVGATLRATLRPVAPAAVSPVPDRATQARHAVTNVGIPAVRPANRARTAGTPAGRGTMTATADSIAGAPTPVTGGPRHATATPPVAASSTGPTRPPGGRVTGRPGARTATGTVASAATVATTITAVVRAMTGVMASRGTTV